MRVSCFIICFFVLPVFSTVTEKTEYYTCEGEVHHVESEHAMNNPECEQYWSVKDHSIATFVIFTPECHSPCKELTAGRIMLTDCVNITLAVICERDYLIENRVHFYGKMVPHSLYNSVNRSHQGVFLSIALLFIVIALYLLKQKQCSSQSIEVMVYSMES